MPYIQQKEREEIDERLKELLNHMNQHFSTGELNYTISSLVLSYLMRKGVNYKHINEVIGVLECAKLEMYRRIAVPYEDGKIDDNGDIYS